MKSKHLCFDDRLTIEKGLKEGLQLQGNSFPDRQVSFYCIQRNQISQIP